MNFLLIFCAKYLIFCLLAVAGLFFLTKDRNNKKQLFSVALIGFLVSFILARIASHFYFDPRPFAQTGIAPLIPHAADNGFPSDHALLSFCVAWLFAFFDKKQGAILFALALVVGVGRVFVRVHSPIDIVGSAIIGLVGIAASYSVLKAYWSKRSQS